MAHATGLPIGEVVKQGILTVCVNAVYIYIYNTIGHYVLIK